jgi:hypothetical protein
MPIQILTAKPWLKSEIISDFRAASPTSPATPVQEAARITKIRTLSDQFRRNGAELAMIAHRLGCELMALRDESPHGQWEKRFASDLAFITKRHANNCIALAQAFKSEADMTGLTLTEALRAARYIIRNASSPTRPVPADAGRTYLRKLVAFHGHLDRTELSEIGPRLPAQDRNQAIEYWTAIVRAGNNAIAQLKRLRKDPPNQRPAGSHSQMARSSANTEIAPTRMIRARSASDQGKQPSAYPRRHRLPISDESNGNSRSGLRRERGGRRAEIPTAVSRFLSRHDALRIPILRRTWERFPRKMRARRDSRTSQCYRIGEIALSPCRPHSGLRGSSSVAGHKSLRLRASWRSIGSWNADGCRSRPGRRCVRDRWRVRGCVRGRR